MADLPAPLQPQVVDMLSDLLMSAKVSSTAEIKPCLTGVTIPMTSDALVQGNSQIRQCHDTRHLEALMGDAGGRVATAANDHGWLGVCTYFIISIFLSKGKRIS